MAPEPNYVTGDEAAEMRALLNGCGLTWQVPLPGRKRTVEATEHTCVRLDNHPGPCLCGCGALGGEPHSDREDAEDWHRREAE